MEMNPESMALWIHLAHGWRVSNLVAPATTAKTPTIRVHLLIFALVDLLGQRARLRKSNRMLADDHAWSPWYAWVAMAADHSGAHGCLQSRPGPGRDVHVVRRSLVSTLVFRWSSPPIPALRLRCRLVPFHLAGTSKGNVWGN